MPFFYNYNIKYEKCQDLNSLLSVFSNSVLIQWGKGESCNNVYLPISYTSWFITTSSGEDGALWSTAFTANNLLNAVYLFTVNNAIKMVDYITIGF